MNFNLRNIRTGELKSFPFTQILELLGDSVNDSISLNGECYRISSCESGTGESPAPPNRRGIYTPTDDTVYYAPLSGETFAKNGNVDYVDTAYGKMLTTHGELNSYVKLPVKYAGYNIFYLSLVFRYHAHSSNQGFFVDTPNDTKFFYYKGFYIYTDVTNSRLTFEQTGSGRQCFIPLSSFEEGKIYLLQYAYNLPSGTNQFAVYLNGLKIQSLPTFQFMPSGTDQALTPKFGSTNNLSNFNAAPCQSDICELLVEKRAWTDAEVIQYANNLGFVEGKAL